MEEIDLKIKTGTCLIGYFSFFNMRSRINVSITIFGAFIISFLIFYSSITFFNEPTPSSLSLENQFYSQNFDSKTKKIFFIGSSFGARINSTLINQELFESGNSDYVFYNLAKSGDSPKERLLEFEYIQNSKPEIVIVDYSIQKFGYKLKETDSSKSDIYNLLGKYFQNPEFSKFVNEFPNPKFVTLKSLLKIIDNDKQTKLYPKYSDKPFYEGPPNAEKILTKEKLEKLALNYEFIDDDYVRSENLEGYEELVQKMHQEKIKIIIIIPPHTKEFLSLIPEDKKQNFLSAMKLFEQKNSVLVYDLLEKFKNEPIWSNLDHVAINPRAEEYSKNISEIIIGEIKR
jgi:hypothetical protein